MVKMTSLWLARFAGVTAFAFIFTGSVQAQTLEYVYKATRYMPQAESQDFNSLADAETFIKAEPSTPIGNSYLRKVQTSAFGEGGILIDYKVPRRKYESYLGGYYAGHMSGNGTDCTGMKCRSEEEMVAASLRAYPLSGNYTATLQGAYLSPPFTMWSSGGRQASVTMNAIHYSGGHIPNERQIVATNGNGSTYIYRVQRSDRYECPDLFTATNNDFGEARHGVWPLFCQNNAKGQVLVRLKQRAPLCSIKDRVGNPCAADTGNKEYRESDFVWEGFGFDRAYNSVADFPFSSGFGDNWAHSFSDRLVFDSQGYVTFWIRSDGYVDRVYEVVGGQGLYYSPNSLNLVLKKPVKNPVDPVDGVWELSRPGESSLWFDANGRLVRKKAGSNILDFQYCAGAELGSDECPSTDLIRRVASTRGRVLDFFYTVLAGPDQQPRLLRIDSAGSVLMKYEHDAQGRLTAAWHDGVVGNGRRYLYAELAQLCRTNVGASAPGCNPASFPYHLTAVEDESGARFASYTYDEKGRVTSSEHAGGVGRVSLNYVSSTETRTSLANGATTTFKYSSEQLKKPLSSITVGDADSIPETVSVGYDSRWRLAHKTLASGSRVSYNYDGAHESVRTEGLSAAGSTTGLTRVNQTDWHASFNEPVERRILDNAGATLSRTKWSYNLRGQRVSTTAVDAQSGAERSTINSYCEQSEVDAALCPIVGLPTAIDGPRTDVNDIASYTYYANDDAACATSPATCAYRKGDLWKITNSLGHVTEFLRYDYSGRLLSSKDANGVVTDMEYLPRGWLASTKVRGTNASSEADDVVTRYEYDLIGQVKKVIQPDGAFIRYEYDAAHRLTDIYDNAGNRIHYTLDAAGARTKEDTRDSNGALKRTLSRIYNQLGQLKTAKTAYDHPTGFTYDASGNGDVTTDALGRKVDNDYDPLNRLAKTLQDVGGINAKTEFKYDALDRLTKVTDPKNLDTTYAYNGFGDQVQLTSPDTGVSTFTYDSAGNRKTETDARNITRTYSYDALNRPTAVAYPTTSLNVGYEYDAVPTVCAAGETFAKGRLSLMTDASGSTQYCYDRFGRMVRKVQTTNGKVFVVRYAYTLAGQLSSLTYPDGAVVTYQRDAQGRISQIDTKRAVAGATTEVLLSQATYHPFGPAAGWTYGNGRTFARPVDLDYRTTAVVDPSAGGLSVGFGFDAVGNIDKLTPAGATNALLTFGYDALNRLTALRDGPSSTAIEAYTYDATGNRQSVTTASGTKTYTYPADSHRLTQAGPDSPRSYDASGNSVQIGGNSFVYNDAGRSSELKQGATLVQTYVYNGKGEQVRKYTAANDRYTVYDETGYWLGDYDNSGSAIQQAIWMNDVPVGLWVGDITQQALYYIESDHLGAPRVVMDPVRNNSVWSWDLKGEAFGNSPPNHDPDHDGIAFTLDVRFPGQRHDQLSGLSYNYYRDYDASVGRYVQSDPIGLHGGVSTYGYVFARPMQFYDAKGLAACPAGMVEPGVPCWLDLGDGNGSGNPNEGRCATAECAAGILPNPKYSPKTECAISCNFKYQWVCSGAGIGTSYVTTPLGGALVGGGCFLAKVLICNSVCDDNVCEIAGEKRLH